MWRKIQKSLATAVPSLILAVFLIVMICYLNRWDSMTAITIIPIWAWTAVGMLACLISWIAFRGLPSIIVFCIWLVTGIGFSEEPQGLIRELIQSIDQKPAPSEESQLRVINVNASGSGEILRKVFDLDPDLIMVQEAPDETTVAEITNKEFGVESAIIVGAGQAIIGRGELMATMVEDHGKAIHARLKLQDEFIIDLTSVDLEPSYPSPYLWKLSTWKGLTERRVSNRRLLRKSLGENQITRSSTGRLIGGGFNTPPGDDVFRPLQSNMLIDAFSVSGTGWGNTYPANYPALRLDQIWSSPNLFPLKTTTRRIADSDHRIVISDFELPGRKPGR
ncbi:MAG: endonuclease/exonuclease/phosphatase family protein [Verrucomicrobiales bacterium]|nr:endonuclease/exonuclease/phosphatase family protein [Verrucomicrobiales bacterium]